MSYRVKSHTETHTHLGEYSIVNKGCLHCKQKELIDIL